MKMKIPVCFMIDTAGYIIVRVKSTKYSDNRITKLKIWWDTFLTQLLHLK